MKRLSIAIVTLVFAAGFLGGCCGCGFDPCDIDLNPCGGGCGCDDPCGSPCGVSCGGGSCGGGDAKSCGGGSCGGGS